MVTSGARFKLDRLLTADRGITGTTWTAGIGGQQWALDALGNWVEVREDLDGNGSYAEALCTDKPIALCIIDNGGCGTELS